MHKIIHRLLYSRVHLHATKDKDGYSPFEIALKEATEEELRLAREMLDIGRGEYGYAGKRWRWIGYRLERLLKKKEADNGGTTVAG